MIKNFLQKIKNIWNNLTYFILMRLFFIASIIILIKNILIKYMSLDNNEFFTYITIFVFFGLVRSYFKYFLGTENKFTNKDKLFICILVLLIISYFVMFYQNII